MLGALSGSGYVGFFRSSDSGAHCRRHCAHSNVGDTNIDGSAGGFAQSSYDQVLTVLPDNPDHLYFGGVGPYRQRMPDCPGNSWPAQSVQPRRPVTRTNTPQRSILSTATLSMSATTVGFIVLTWPKTNGPHSFRIQCRTDPGY